ncbi:MAG: class I SAM-dependent methyltransferase [Candidatus Sumerlaeota bacterium]|nr:class I SAM-dependent methyltransferase [Candidatus Sumerlaeota bacterium]
MAKRDESQALANQREYWDANLDTKNLSDQAPERLNLDEEIAFLSSPEYEYARERMGDVQGRIVLDVGCGLGVNALALARAGARVVAFDLSLKRLEALMQWARAEGLADRILPVQGEIENAPLLDTTVDRAFTKSVLIHTRIEAAGSEIARALKPGGRGVFIEPSHFNPFVNLYRRLFAPKEWREIAFYFDARRWARFGQSFARLERRPFFFVSFLAFYWQFARRDLRRFRRSLRFWGKVDAALFRICPLLKRLRWMDTAIADKEP